MIDFIKDKLEIRRKVYLTDSNIILEDYLKEKEKIEEYNGRQLLEMLQNADDEVITEKEKTCFIKLFENQLIIANNGRKFSEGGIESLMYSNISPKVLEQNKVGQKGLGFRSILSWANKITVKSYDFGVEFSENNAKEFLKSLIVEKPEIKLQLDKKEKQAKYPIATLRCPKILKIIPKDLSKYDTYIVIDLKGKQTQEVQEQINIEINKEVLLFLNNLEKIIVESPESNFEIEKVINESKTIIREFNYDTNETFEKVWNLKTRKGKYQNKSYELKVAWNENLDDEIGRLYSYFKTNVKFPFPALIHGTFDLTSDRNHFTPKSKHNTFLVDELIQLLIDTALVISDNEISYKPLKLLSIQGKENFDTFFDDNDFSEKLKNKIRENKVYPTIANVYISYEDEPVYYQNNYAEILPSNKFINLLPFTEDDSVKDTIDWIGHYTYKKEYFFNTISEISSQLSIEQRARLIIYLTKDFSDLDIQRNKLPNIFIDQDNQIIHSDSEIFLPPMGEKIEIPLKLNLKIINSELFTHLKKVLGSENAEVIEDRLKFFGIKVYRFGEIFRRIVSDFNSNPDSKNIRSESIKDLISNLYELYQLNKDKEGIDINIPSNVSIPILNKNNGETKVSSVYLGKEYENKLCEILFEYDKSKLVGSPKVLGLEGKEFANEFLKWLGVAKYPRKKIITAKNEYGHFAIKHFPYKEKRIYGYDASLTSFKKLERKGYWLNEIRVETIEDLENILKNNSNENILYWLNCDSRITELAETNPNSQIKFLISSKQYYAYIHNGDLPSYLLWKIKLTNWIKTETDKITKPTDCCISKTITKDFSPFIEIPKINFEKKLFKDAKISKEDNAYFLFKVGVNKEISDFSTDTIYSMLSNLQDIDKDGKKAKLIYRELAENLDDKKVDKNSDEYKSFIDSGFVFCKKNGNYTYETVKNVYYVEDKTFGEDIINQFHTIEIDRRKGAKKINTLFGVMPLENLEFKLKSLPSLHQLNESFQNEVEELKPYFYAFRLAKDADGKELNWIKNSKITLCTQINPQYKHNEEIRNFDLKSYEFIYIEKRNEVYLLVDDGQKYNSIADFQSDYKFADSIAEIYSSIIKVDTHRSSFRELFKESRMNRSYILETDIDDKNFEKLKTSKKKLNVVDDPKIQFWFSILSSLNRDYEYRKYRDSEFEILIMASLHQNVNDYKINYEDINDISNFPIIIQLFTELKIDTSKFNENTTVALNIIPYYEEKLQQLKNDSQNNFEILLFNFLKSKKQSEKETFLNKQFDYENYTQFEIENTVKTDIKKLFIDTIYSKFQVDLSEDIENIDTTEIYKNNLNELSKQIKSLNKPLLNDIIENSNLRSLIYFAQFENIIQEYNLLLEKSDNTKEINFNNKTHKTPKDDFEELYQLIIKNDPTTKIENIKTSTPELTVEDDKKGKSKGASKNRISTSDKETLGFIGEIVVLESLKKRFGNENVIWDSGFAKKANINPKGDDNKHYDIKYKNKNRKWNYVEVKSTASDKLEFNISNSEVNFGIDNKNNYEIMIVVNALEEKILRRIKKLTKPFKFRKDESFTNNSNFLVKNVNFKIKLIEE